MSSKNRSYRKNEKHQPLKTAGVYYESGDRTRIADLAHLREKLDAARDQGRQAMIARKLKGYDPDEPQAIIEAAEVIVIPMLHGPNEIEGLDY